MLKVALLYADKVNLLSPMASILVNGTELPSEYTTIERLELMIRIGPFISDGSAVENYEYQIQTYKGLLERENQLKAYPRHQRRKNKDTLKQYNDIIQKITNSKKIIENKGRQSWHKLDNPIQEIKTQLEIDKLVKIRESGVLNVAQLNINKLTAMELIYRGAVLKSNDIEDLLSQITTEFSQKIIELMIQSKQEYPFIDQELRGIFSTYPSSQNVNSDNERLNKLQIIKAKNVQLVSELMAILPSFDQLPIDEVLSVRADLEEYLVNFRSVMVDYSKVIEVASWDEDFAIEAEQIYNQKIRPAIDAIKYRVDSTNYLRTLNDRVINSQGILTKALGIGFTAYNNLDPIITSLAALGFVTADVLQSAKTFVKERNEIKQDKLFFYYELDKNFR